MVDGADYYMTAKPDACQSWSQVPTVA